MSENSPELARDARNRVFLDAQTKRSAWVFLFVRDAGIEPATFSMSMRRSTTELIAQNFNARCFFCIKSL